MLDAARALRTVLHMTISVNAIYVATTPQLMHVAAIGRSVGLARQLSAEQARTLDDNGMHVLSAVMWPERDYTTGLLFARCLTLRKTTDTDEGVPSQLDVPLQELLALPRA